MCFETLAALGASAGAGGATGGGAALGGAAAAASQATAGALAVGKVANTALLLSSAVLPTVLRPSMPRPPPALSASNDAGIRARIAARAQARGATNQRSTMLTGSGGAPGPTGGAKTALGQ